MAYTKILVIHQRLDTSVNYVLNPAKTAAAAEDGLSLTLDYALNPEKNEQRLYEGAINCRTETAYREMTDTKRRWGKEDKRQGYHIIQSFKPGEISPELAIEVGRRFTEQYLAERYQAVYSVHLDKDHLHVHIVFNSVSFVDGRKYHADNHEYERNIQRISDELCREYNLSVIEAKEKTKSKTYAEWNADKQNRPTVRGIIRADIDEAIALAFTFQNFIEALRAKGYAVKYGPNVKYMGVRPPGSSGFFRLYKLGENYSEQAIRERIVRQRHGQGDRGAVPAEKKQAQSPRSRGNGSSGPRPHKEGSRVFVPRAAFRRTAKLRGFQALVWHYMYLLGKVDKREAPMKRVPFSLRAEIVKYERYNERFRFLRENRIETTADLQRFIFNSKSLIDTLSGERQQLHIRKRGAKNAPETQASLSQEIAQLSATIRELRKGVRFADRIAAESDAMREMRSALNEALRIPAAKAKDRSKPRGKEDVIHEPRR